MFPLTSQRTQQWDMVKPMVDVLSVEFGPCRGGTAVNPSPGAMASPAAPVPSTPSLVVLHFVETLDGWNSELRQLPVMAPILSMND